MSILVRFSPLSMTAEKYDTILKLLSGKLELKYIPKRSLDTDVLECILETFKKNEEPS